MFMTKKARTHFLPIWSLPGKKQSKNNSPLHVLQSVMTERHCMHVVVQDTSLVIGASHQCLALFLRRDIEGLVVDALEASLDHCILFLLCLTQGHACTTRCSSHSFSLHRSPHCEVLPLLRCVSLASHRPSSTSSVSVPQTP